MKIHLLVLAVVFELVNSAYSQKIVHGKIVAKLENITITISHDEQVVSVSKVFFPGNDGRLSAIYGYAARNDRKQAAMEVFSDEKPEVKAVFDATLKSLKTVPITLSRLMTPERGATMVVNLVVQPIGQRQKRRSVVFLLDPSGVHGQALLKAVKFSD